MKLILIITFSLFTYFSFAQEENDPDYTVLISKYISGTNVSGKYSVWRKTNSNNGNTSKITRPFIICEGFDPLNSWSGQDVYNFQMNPSFLSCLRNRGYDIIILDLDNNSLDIRKNAELFIKLIEDIKTEVANNGSNNSIIAGGVSMGGLITRYALAKMEHDNLDHRVDKFITFDTPHRGANIPLGYQHFVDTWLHPILQLENASAALDFINANPLEFMNNNFLDNYGSFFIQTAAVEMSANYYQQNAVRAAFLNSMNNIGNYPNKLRKIAVSNGANMQNQGFNAGDKLFEWTPGICVIDQNINYPFNLGSFHLLWCPLTMQQLVNAMPGDNDGRVYQFTMGQQLQINGNNNFVPTISKYNYDHDYITAPANCNMDNVPGGYYELDFLRNLANTLNNATTSIPYNWSKEFCIRLPVIGRICKRIGIWGTIVIPWYKVLGRMNSDADYKFAFIPTISAFDINNNDWFFDISQIPYYPYPRDINITPFNAIFASNTNSYHAILNDNNIENNLIDEISPSHLYIQNRIFDLNYKNTFIAENISIGNNVDIVPYRTPQGVVIAENGSEINFIASNTINIEDGFDSNNSALDFSINPSLNFSSCTFKKCEIKENIFDKNITDNKPKEIQDTLSIISETTISTMNSNNNTNYDVNYYNIGKSIDIIIYPNPTKDIINIGLNLSVENNLSIYIVNSFGQTVITLKNNISLEGGVYKFSFNSMNLGKGFYFIKFQTNNETIVKKLVVN